MRKKFYDIIRNDLFNYSLTKKQVEGIEAILNEAERRGMENMNQLAYILATAYHETAATMQPIEEWGKGKGKSYGIPDTVTGKTYYGRGHVQLTWAYNYKYMGKRLGIDLYRNPELALRMDISVKILFEGMIYGCFTGKKLADYITFQKVNFPEARRIVNGVDRKLLIAGYAEKFVNALSELNKK